MSEQQKIDVFDLNDEETNSHQLEILIERHQQLDDEADALATMQYLSPPEKTKLKTLKVLRLRTKDAISKLQAELRLE
jgi:uncharacterized protein YdcH (DUF465 family)